MQLQIELLQTFIAVAEHMNFTKAADAINLTQSAVSMQMKRLEEETEKKLFTKSGRSFVLTEAGERLLMHALKIMKAHDEACFDMKEPELDGVILLGTPVDYAENISFNILKKFSELYPKIRIDTICETSVKLKKRLDNNKLDLAVMVGIPGGREILEEKMLWIASKDYHMKSDEPIPLAVYPDSCICRKTSFELLTANDIKYRIAYESGNSSVLKAAVRSGTAIAPVVEQIYSDDFITLTSADGLPELPSATVSLHKNPNSDTEIIRALEDFISQMFDPEHIAKTF